MTVLKNSRRERFAQEVAKGVSAGTAYLRAGYKTQGHSADVCGSRLLKSAEVSARIAELRAPIVEAAVERLELSVKKSIDELARIGFAKLPEHLRGEAGQPFDFSQVTREDVVAINAKKGALVELIKIQREIEAAAAPSKDAVQPPTAPVIDFLELRKTFPRSFTMEPQK